MHDPNRMIPILKGLKELWERNPHLRFSQLITNLQYDNVEFSDIYYTKDDDWLEWIEKELEK